MADEPINVLSRRLSKFFTNTDSTNFDYQRYREREATEQVLYRSDQKSFKCVCLSHRLGSTSPSTMGHAYDNVKLEEGGIKKAKIKIWFVGDDDFMNGPNPNPFTTSDEGLKVIYTSMAREAIVTKSYSNISFNDLLTVEKRGDDYYVVEHFHDEMNIIRETTDTPGPVKSTDAYAQTSNSLISKLSDFISLPPIGDAANQIVAAYPNARPIANEIVAVAGRLNTNPFWLANLINFETGGEFSSKTTNKAGSSAVGLIQFMDFTAASLLGLDPGPRGSKNRKESRLKFLAMSSKEQMKWVEIYLKKFSSSGFPNPTDLYMAVFFPKAIGRGPNYNIYNWYVQNKGLAAAEHFKKVNPGVITAGDYTKWANKNAKLPTGL